jgi:hypothetical protein
MAQPYNAPMMPPASRHGFFLGLALVIMQTVFYLADIKFDSGLGNISYLILIGGLFLSIRNYRDQLNNGTITYGKSVGYGVLVALMAGVISSVFVFVLYSFIDTNMIDKMLIEAEIAMEAQNLPPDQLEMAMDINRKMLTPISLSIMSIIGYGFMGLVFSLVLSVFMKKEAEGGSFDKDTL